MWARLEAIIPLLGFLKDYFLNLSSAIDSCILEEDMEMDRSVTKYQDNTGTKMAIPTFNTRQMSWAAR